MEYAIDVAQACQENNIETVAVTAGYISPDPRVKFFKYFGTVNINLKSFIEQFYTKVCSGHLNNVFETLKYLKHETEVWFEVRTLLILGENDIEREINDVCARIVEHRGPDVLLHFSTFHPDWTMLYKTTTS